MLAPPGQTRAPRVSRAAHREPRQSCSSVARQSRTGLLDEVDGAFSAAQPRSWSHPNRPGCPSSDIV